MTFYGTTYYSAPLSSKSTPNDRPEDNCNYLLMGIRQAFDVSISENEPLFTTNVDNLYDIFLMNLPAEARQHYNCNACRSFVNRYGGLVTINEDGFTHPVMWGFDCPAFFNKAILAVDNAVRNAKVTGVFIPSERTLGIPRTNEWTHMYVKIPKQIVHKSILNTAYQKMAEKREDFKMLVSAVQKYNISDVTTAVNLLKANSLYRSEKILGIAEWFLEVMKEVKGNKNFTNILWRKVATAPTGFCHISSSMIGTLLDDIHDGYSFDAVKRRFDEKMSPTKYQRPQAAPSVGNVKRAEKIVAKLGLENSLKRRFARLEEIGKLWEPEPMHTTNNIPAGIFSGVKTKDKSAVKRNNDITPPATTMTWDKFMKTVLPEAKKIELYIKHQRDNYTAIVTAENFDAPPIIQWDTEEFRNPFSWYLYNNGSPANRWNLREGMYVEVTAITLQPNMWQEGYTHIGDGVIFILKNCKDAYNKSLALFPEILKSDLREVRSTIEAYSKMNKLGGYEEASACGLSLGSSETNWNCKLKVTTDVGERFYILDRWD